MGKMPSCREDGVQITHERADEPRQTMSGWIPEESVLEKTAHVGP